MKSCYGGNVIVNSIMAINPKTKERFEREASDTGEGSIGYHTDLETSRLVFDNLLGMELILPRSRQDLVRILPDKQVEDFPAGFDVESEEMLKYLIERAEQGEIAHDNIGLYYLFAVNRYLEGTIDS